ncbi:MAG: cytochrome [Phenylobacterium sp.]|nr:cytochrome [Phenylobacterium sp.]
MTAGASHVPDHVPPEMVGTFNLYKSPEMLPTPFGDPHAAVSRLHQGGPAIFYAPQSTRDGDGAWVVTKAEDQRRVLQDSATFSSFRRIFSAAIGEDWPVIPLELDPPEHGKYRALINPLFSPKRIGAMEPFVRQKAITLIEGLKARGTSCEVMSEFAFPLAVSVFLSLMGIADDRLTEFVGWANDLLHKTPEDRTRAARRVLGFLDDLAAQRRAEPTDDFMTFLVTVDFEGRKLTEQEVRAISVLLFIGGLDTVAAAIGLDLYYLARNPDRQQELREHPERMQSAIEEMLRAFATITPIRTATRDVLLNGAPIKRGDLVACPSMVSSRDPDEFTSPDEIDFTREDNRHVAFSYGPHRCVGSHLARRELIIALTEWFDRVPPFGIKAGTAPVTFGGFVFGVENLVVDWS